MARDVERQSKGEGRRSTRQDRAAAPETAESRPRREGQTGGEQDRTGNDWRSNQQGGGGTRQDCANENGRASSQYNRADEHALLLVFLP